MRFALRAAPFALAVVAALPSRGDAQPKQLELRIDALSYERSTGRSTIDLRFPGAAAIAVYLNNSVALESRVVGIRRTTTESAQGVPTFTTTNLTAALFLPMHLRTTRGRSGPFVAPGLIVNSVRAKTAANPPGTPGSDVTVNYGIDVGFKHTLQGRVSLRHALTYRTGDNLADTYGVTSGISIFFR